MNHHSLYDILTGVDYSFLPLPTRQAKEGIYFYVLFILLKTGTGPLQQNDNYMLKINEWLNKWMIHIPDKFQYLSEQHW